MNRKNPNTAIALWVLIASLFLSPFAASAAVTLSVDGAQQYQTIDGFGVNINSLSWKNGELMPALDRLSDEMGATLWRVVFDMEDWEAENDNSDPAVMDWTYYDALYGNDKFQNLWGTIGYLNQKGASTGIVLSFMGRVPDWMGGEYINTSAEDEWVEMIVSLIYYARETMHLSFSQIDPLNEPDWNGYEGPKVDKYQYVRLLNKLAQKLDSIGLSDVGIVGPTTATITTGVSGYMAEMMKDSTVMSKVRHFGLHDFTGSTGSADQTIKRSAYPDRNFHMTEIIEPADIFATISQGPAAIYVWEGYDSVYHHAILMGNGSTPPNDAGEGPAALSYNASAGTYSPRKCFYQYEQLFKFVPPGSVRIAASQSDGNVVLYGFHHQPTGQVTLVGRNTGYGSIAYAGTLANLTGVSDFQFYWTSDTDSSKNFARLNDVSVTNGTFAFNAPANSIFTLTGFVSSEDTTPPSVSITAPQNGSTVSASVSVSATASDDKGVARIEFYLDDVLQLTDTTSPYGWTWDTSLASEGSHVVKAAAYDEAGNSASSSVTVSVNNFSPDTSITSKPANPANQTNCTFAFTSNESGSSFECRIDNGVYGACSSPKTYSLNDGSHVFDVRAIDVAGNSDPTPATYSWTIDTTVPDTTITGKPVNPTNQMTATFIFSATESARFECQIDGGGYTTCTSPNTYTLSAGNHTFDVRSIDSAGNVDASPASYSWVIDTTAPDTTITSRPASLTNQTSASFAFSATEEGSSFTCKMDNGSYSACTSPKAYTLSAGNHTFSVQATDKAGNTDATAATWSWAIDTTAPDTTITSQPANPTNQTSARFAFSSTEAGASFECRMDGGGYAACTSPKTYALTAGNHTFDARSIDPAGSTDGSPATYSWAIDTNVPDTTITSQPANPTNQTSASFTFSSTEAGASFECQMDGGGYAPCPSPKTYSLSAGSHTFDVRSTDAAGNVDASPATCSWVIDTTAPDTTITGRPANPTNQTSATFTFIATESARFECQMDGGGYSACTSPGTYTMTAGNHQFDVRSIDTAGNTDAAPATYSWVIDTTHRTRPSPPACQPDEPDECNIYVYRHRVSHFECRIDNGELCSPARAQRPIDNLASNDPYLHVRSMTRQGTCRCTSPATYSWVIDTTAPDTTITGQPRIPRTRRVQVFHSLRPRLPTFECRIDNGRVLACTSPTSFSLAARDPHLHVRSIDTAGNIDATPATYSWVIDTTAPDTTITSQPLNPDEPDERKLLLHFDRGWLGLRVPDRRRGICGLHESQDLSTLPVRHHTFNVRSMTWQATPMPLRQPTPG